MGDDFIDAPAIAAAGIGISVPTALPEALAAADYVTRRRRARRRPGGLRPSPAAQRCPRGNPGPAAYLAR
jgi:cation transport ATPase